MARDVNSATLLGNVGDAPKEYRTQGGALIAKFSLATSQNYKDQSGEWQQNTQWHDCVAFGKTAEIIIEKIGKGSRVFVQGVIEYGSYDSKDGHKVNTTQIKVMQIADQTPRRDADFGQGNQYAAPAPSQPASQVGSGAAPDWLNNLPSTDAGAPVAEDDLPF